MTVPELGLAVPELATTVRGAVRRMPVARRWPAGRLVLQEGRP
jgi:hypothetical protein